jgi:uncharacterized membrane protein
MGLLLLGIYIGITILCAIFFPKLYETIMAVTASHLVIGRVPGITVGYAMNASFYTVVGLNFAIETMLVLFLYPLFILSWNKLLGIGLLERWVSHARKNAEKYHPLIEKYGMLGLFLFVWFPFWMTGPIIGSFIGYLMGFRHRVTLSIVLSGTLIAISCWGFALQHLQKWAFSVDPRGPWFIVALMAMLITVGFIIRRFLKR